MPGLKKKVLLLFGSGIIFMSCQGNIESHQKRDQEAAMSHSAEEDTIQKLLTEAPDTIANHPDHDFVHAMIAQHELAISLANQELKTGQENEMRTIADHIISHHTSDKVFLEKAAKRIDNGAEEKHTVSVLHRELKVALDSMRINNRSLAQSNNPDQQFRHLIINHHRASLTIAQAYLNYGKDADLKGYAARLVQDHTAEILDLSRKAR